jgi:hypothetical protein
MAMATQSPAAAALPRSFVVERGKVASGWQIYTAGGERVVFKSGGTRGERAVASFLAAVLTEIYLCASPVLVAKY